MTVVEQFVEKYNLRQKKYVDLSFVGDAYEYSTFESAVADVNANVTINALTNGETGAVRVFKGEDVSIIRLLEDVKLTAPTIIQNNAIVDFNGFTMSEVEEFPKGFNFLSSNHIESNPIGVVFYARNGGKVRGKNGKFTLDLNSEYDVAIGLTIENNQNDGYNDGTSYMGIRVGNPTKENACVRKTIIEDCFISITTTGEAYKCSMVGLYDANAKNSDVIISNTKIVVINENLYNVCRGVWSADKDVFKTLSMINCDVELHTDQESGSVSGVNFSRGRLTMVDCFVKAEGSVINPHGVTLDNGTARIQNTDIIALSPFININSAIGFYNNGTAYLKDTNVFGVTSGIQNQGTLYVNGGYLRAPGHGGLYNSDNTENTGAKAYVSCATLARAVGELQEFDAIYNAADGSTYNAYGCHTWFDGCTFKGAAVVCKDSEDGKSGTVFISNSYSEKGYRCDEFSTLNLGVGVTGSMLMTGSGGKLGTVNYTDEDYSEIVKANVPTELYATIADYLGDLHKARIDLANLVDSDKLATINTLVYEANREMESLEKILVSI